MLLGDRSSIELNRPNARLLNQPSDFKQLKGKNIFSIRSKSRTNGINTVSSRFDYQGNPLTLKQLEVREDYNEGPQMQHGPPSSRLKNNSVTSMSSMKNLSLPKMSESVERADVKRKMANQAQSSYISDIAAESMRQHKTRKFVNKDQVAPPSLKNLHLQTSTEAGTEIQRSAKRTSPFESLIDRRGSKHQTGVSPLYQDKERPS